MSSHLVKKFFLHALAWKQVLFVDLAYKKYSYVRCNVVFTSEKTIHSHTITLLFSLIILKNTILRKNYILSVKTK